jgi:dCTP deaminase
MPLSDKEILAARERGDIVIEPFDERQLGTDSYDVRLGEFFYREVQDRNTIFHAYPVDTPK